MASLFAPLPTTKLGQERRSLLIQLGGYDSRQLGELLHSQSGKEHLERVTARKEHHAFLHLAQPTIENHAIQKS